MKAASQQEFAQRLGTVYERKSLRWKVGSGWKTQLSFVDTQFKADTEFDGKSTYDLFVATACK
jgi:hypothetical protein